MLVQGRRDWGKCVQSRCLMGVKPLEGWTLYYFIKQKKVQLDTLQQSKFKPITNATLFSCSTGEGDATQNSEVCFSLQQLFQGRPDDYFKGFYPNSPSIPLPPPPPWQMQTITFRMDKQRGHCLSILNVLLYSTWDYIQSLGIESDGRQYEKKSVCVCVCVCVCIYVYMYDWSLCCTAEIETTL